MYRLTALFFSLLFMTMGFAQVIIDNPSFEGDAEDATLPNGWLACKAGTTPDILPGSWGVYNEPSEGETYMGLITRTDKTWESVGQRLSSPIEKGFCYSLKVDLAHSKTYTGYNKPLKVRIWAGRTRCDRGQLICISEVIKHSNWKTYEFDFEPTSEYNYIIIEAYFPTEHPIPYKGNILVDNLSDIEICERA